MIVVRSARQEYKEGRRTAPDFLARKTGAIPRNRPSPAQKLLHKLVPAGYPKPLPGAKPNHPKAGHSLPQCHPRNSRAFDPTTCRSKLKPASQSRTLAAAEVILARLIPTIPPHSWSRLKEPLPRRKLAHRHPLRSGRGQGSSIQKMTGRLSPTRATETPDTQ